MEAAPPAPPRPWPAALAIGALAQTLFSWRVTIPHQLVFDEVHYVPAARALRALTAPANSEHPLIGKLLIAVGIQLFGDHPLGWRALSTVAGTAVVMGVFAILWLGTRQLRPAVVGALLTILNFTVFVQARIAMLDGFMAAFVVLGVAAMLWSMRAHGAAMWRRWIGAAVLLGLAVACKWTAAPYVAAAAGAFLVLRHRRADRWPGMNPAFAIGVLAGVSIATYFVTFAPAFFYAAEPLTWAQLVPFQLDMYRLQTQILPPHTYQSSWSTWPLDLRPIWYLYEPADGAQRGILMIGNPVVLWGGLIAVCACAIGWVRTRDTASGASAMLWLFSIAIWAAIPKSLGFFYYFYLSSIWLPIALAIAFDRFGRRLRYGDEAFVLLSAVLFVHFYPILAATALPGPQAFTRWTWFDSWR
ncbi:phospholipid carrier-dependent glycosyltransferase [Sphingomonas oligophenolica]|uniref:Polyprenol-phosphate-mannose--protein mannosyltransferase n=1 Tax=Sphingomonas oligophenolica TaxID=301154 RepID=A0A502CMW7_9SPHN|nr:glycosyltransferase family 39 protein [Sphingomonas oligophenolica]TPG13041.1 phospholipid carrier-dependent glycosyltransferase [Sphingomonas oligophenolica]